MVKQLFRWLLAAFVVTAGVMHFVNPDFFAALIPPSWPARLAAVYLSGVAEISLGSLLLIPRSMRLAAWGLIALFIAVYPANIYHALSGGISGPGVPASMANPTVAWARLPFQFVFIAWAWWFTRPPHPR